MSQGYQLDHPNSDPNSLGVGDFIGNPKSKFPFGNDSILTANLVLSNNTYREEKSGSCRDGEGVD